MNHNMDKKKEKPINISKEIIMNNKKINLNINNFVTFIYGSNGTGKTTISKKLKELSDSQFSFFPFNEFYISQNIFFYDQGNIKINQKITANRGQSFITTELRSIWELNKNIYDYQKKVLDECNIQNEYLLWQSKNNYKDVLINFSWNGFLELLYIEKVKPLIAESISNVKKADILNLDKISNEEYFQFFTDNFKKFIDYTSFKEIQSNFKIYEFEEKIIKVKNIPLINKFNYFIDEFNKFFEKFFEKINKEINEYNLLVKDKQDYENSLSNIALLIEKYEESSITIDLKSRKNITEIEDWLKEGDEIHKKHKLKKICLYCSQLMKETILIKNNIYALISFDWNEIINKLNKIVLNFYEQINGLTSTLFSNSEDFEILKSLKEINKIISKIDTLLLNITPFLLNINQQTNSLEKIEKIKIIFKKFKSITVETFESIKEDVFSHFIYENADTFILKEIEASVLKEIHEKISNVYLKKVEKEKLNEITKTLNETLKQLDNLQIKPFEMKIKFSKKGDLTKEDYSPLITIINKESKSLIENISNGQRKMISFIFYTMQLIEINKKNKEKGIETIAIIDDVSDGMDFSSYFIVKNIIKNYIGKKNEIKAVLLTHDYSFSNIYLQSNEGKKTENQFIDLFSLDFSGKLTKIDFDVFNMPDLLLAANIRKDIKNYNGETQTIIFSIWITILLRVIEMKFIELCHVINKDILIYSETIHSDMKLIVSSNTLYKDIFELFLKIRKLWLSEIANEKKEIKNIKLLIKPIQEFYKYLEKNNLISNVYNELVKDINHQFQQNIKNFINFEFSNPKIPFRIKNSWDAARVMMFSKIYSGKEIDEWQRWLSNYLRHSANNVSSPMIALNLEELKEKIVKI